MNLSAAVLAQEVAQPLKALQRQQQREQVLIRPASLPRPLDLIPAPDPARPTPER